MVDVVREPDPHAPLVRVDQGRLDDVARLAAEPDVVERELEGLAGAAEEVGGLAGDVDRALPAVVVETDLQHYSAARSEAL